MKHPLLSYLLFLSFWTAAIDSFAQFPIKWKQSGNWNGFEIVINQDPQNILLSITNTTLKKSIPKETFSGFMPDIKQSADYQNILASLAQTIQERDLARTQYESEVREHENTKRKMAELIAIVKQIRAVHEKDTAILIWIPKNAFNKQ